MLRTLQIIYDRFYIQASSEATGAAAEIFETNQVIRFLFERSKITPIDPIYTDLINEIRALKTKYVPSAYIERFCLSRISEQLIDKYPVNVAEVFVLAYVLLNTVVEINLVYLKLGNSGLITTPTILNGEKVQDIEAIAQFIIRSLSTAELITVTNTQSVIPGKLLQRDV